MTLPRSRSSRFLLAALSIGLMTLALDQLGQYAMNTIAAKTELNEATIEQVRESATANAFDRMHKISDGKGGFIGGAYQARTEFNDARSKYGLGEASASEHNKFMKDRERVEKREKGSFNPETYVQNMLGRQSASRGTSAPPVQPTEPTVDPRTNA